MPSPAYSLALFEGAAQRFGSSRPRYLEGLFAPQRAFVDDRSKRKAALCGRRAGKTEGLVGWLLDGCYETPGETSVYVSLSQKHARRILWNTLKRVTRRIGLGMDYNEQSLIATLPNESRIWVTGCPDQSQCEDLRGDRYKRVAVDEAQSFPSWLEYLVNDVIDPALMDLDGELALSGSPGLTPAGFFYDVTDGEQAWPTHRWTCLDNPHVPGAKYLARKLKENRWEEDHPTYQREYLGRWVRDDEAIVYPYDARRNAYTELPEGVYTRVLTIDLGFKPDGCGFVIGASRRGFPDWYAEKAWREHELVPQRLSARIAQIRHEWAARGKPIHRIAVDEGALGKMIAEGLRFDGLPVIAAKKRDKVGNIHLLRGGLLAGTVHVHPFECRDLIEEWQLLPWNEDRDDHEQSYVDDCSDSTLYNYTEHRLLYTPEEEPDAADSPKAQEAERKALYEETRRKVLQKQRGAFGRRR